MRVIYPRCSGAVSAEAFYVAHALNSGGFMTTAEIAERLGVSRSTVERTLKREAPPSHKRAPPRLAATKRKAINKRRELVAKLAKAVSVKTAHRGKTTRSAVVQVKVKRWPTVWSIVKELREKGGRKVGYLYPVPCTVFWLMDPLFY